MTTDPVRFATRGSQLALAQARQVTDRIEARRRTAELVEITTTGDELDDELIHQLGTTGAFVRTLDQAVLDGEVDGAIHSMKDVPTEQPEELIIAAIPPRGSIADVLVTPTGNSLEELPKEAVVGTSSIRRAAQLHRRRPDISVEPIRGNIDTRLVKLYASAKEDEGVAIPEVFLERVDNRDPEVHYDAIILAEVGLKRAGFDDEVATSVLEEWPTAPGQGAIAVVTLDGDFAEWVNDTLDDPRSRVETTVERCILARLGGGCVAPIGINAILQGEHVQTQVQVLDREGETVIDASRQLPVETYVEGAKQLAEALIDRGADALIAQARRDEPTPPHRD